MAAPILIWGAGAIGGSVGAWLKRAGHDVTFVDVVPEHVAAIRDPAHGLRITGPVEQFSHYRAGLRTGGTFRQVAARLPRGEGADTPKRRRAR